AARPHPHPFPTRRSSDLTPPCGVPASGVLTPPSSSTPALSHFPSRRSSAPSRTRRRRNPRRCPWSNSSKKLLMSTSSTHPPYIRSEEHTSELQSREKLVC